MTDKELAKEYVDKLYAEKVNNKDFDKDGHILYQSEDISDAFLAGVEAGKPKWHKVADGNLPKRTGEYLTNIGVLTWDYYGDGRYGWHTEFCEHCDCMDDVDSDEVIAWCEIPQYTKE